jgi:propanediol utilization protein
LVGLLEIRQTQAEQLGVKAYSRVSGGLEKVSLRLSANESFQDVEKDLAAMTGVSLGHSRHGC